MSFPTIPPSALVRRASNGICCGGLWVLSPTLPPSVLVSNLREGPAMAAGLESFDLDAADCRLARCHFLVIQHQCLREGPAMAAGPRCLALMQQTSVLPGVIAYIAVISAGEIHWNQGCNGRLRFQGSQLQRSC